MSTRTIEQIAREAVAKIWGPEDAGVFLTEAEVEAIILSALREVQARSTYAQGWDDHVEAAKAQIEELRARVAELEADLREDRHLAKLADENLVLIKRVAELEADKARLDWLEASPYRHVEGDYWDTGNPYWRCQDRKNVNTIACIGPDIRAAIDAAMKGTQ